MNKSLFRKFSKSNSSIENDIYLKQIIRHAILATLEHEKFPFDASVSVTLCDNEYIKVLNNKYRGVDKHTDVLSFPMYEDGDFDYSECISGAMLGDIVISLEKAFEQSKEYNHSFEREVCFLVCHSTFHLLGYDHDTEENTKQMREKEEYILNKLNITRE